MQRRPTPPGITKSAKIGVDPGAAAHAGTPEEMGPRPQCPVVIYDSEGQGRGLAATVEIQEGQLICKYQLEVCKQTHLSRSQPGLFLPSQCCC